MQKLLENPTSLISVSVILILILFFFYSRKIKFTTKILINVSLLIGVSLILHFLGIYHLPQGGIITLGGMIPLLLISFRYGVGIGIFAGFVFGLINILQDPFILHPMQVLLDYPLPPMAMGLAGFFPKKIFLGVIISFGGRFLCHFLSGIIFFSSYAPEGMSPAEYSFVVNASHMFTEMFLCCLLIKILPLGRLLSAMKE